MMHTEVIAKGLLRIARQLAAMFFDSEEEKQKYIREHRVRPETRLIVRKKTTPNTVTETDREYFDSIDKKDMGKVRKMVDAAAKKAGFTIGPIFHGGLVGNTFDWSKMKTTSEGRGFTLQTKKMSQSHTLLKQM